MSYLIAFLSDILSWLQTLFVALPLYILNLLLTGLAAFLNDIPEPSFVADGAGWIASMPPLVAYLLGSFQIAAGASIVIGAFVIRFLIRRIPFIG